MSQLVLDRVIALSIWEKNQIHVKNYARRRVPTEREEYRLPKPSRGWLYWSPSI